jgi:hypothetical protein
MAGRAPTNIAAQAPNAPSQKQKKRQAAVLDDRLDRSKSKLRATMEAICEKVSALFLLGMPALSSYPMAHSCSTERSFPTM